jgi:hypothetical protein
MATLLLPHAAKHPLKQRICNKQCRSSLPKIPKYAGNQVLWKWSPCTQTYATAANRVKKIIKLNNMHGYSVWSAQDTIPPRVYFERGLNSTGQVVFTQSWTINKFVLAFNGGTLPLFSTTKYLTLEEIECLPDDTQDQYLEQLDQDGGVVATNLRRSFIARAVLPYARA